jgi:hypothetical protein
MSKSVNDLKWKLKMEAERLSHHEGLKLKTFLALNQIGDRLGVKRKSGEHDNEYFSRIESDENFFDMRDQVMLELKEQAPSFAKRLEADERLEASNFMKELQKL